MKYIFNIILFSILISNLTLSQLQTNVNNNGLSFNFSLGKIKPAMRLGYGSNYASFRQNNKETLTNSLYSLNADLGITTTKNFFPTENIILRGFSKNTISNDEIETYNAALSTNSFFGIGLSYLNISNELTYDNISSVFIIGPTDIQGTEYKFTDKQSIKLLTGSNIAWFWVEYQEFISPEYDLKDNYADITRFGLLVRFGNKYQSDVQLQIYKGISVYGNAQRAIVFPRTLFLKMLCSEIIFEIGNSALDYFTYKIKTSSPYIYPIVDFILKTGLNYGITELQKKKMNWPFNSEIPLIIDQYKIGLQIEF